MGENERRKQRKVICSHKFLCTWAQPTLAAAGTRPQFSQGEAASGREGGKDTEEKMGWLVCEKKRKQKTESQAFREEKAKQGKMRCPLQVFVGLPLVTSNKVSSDCRHFRKLITTNYLNSKGCLLNYIPWYAISNLAFLL